MGVSQCKIHNEALYRTLKKTEYCRALHHKMEVDNNSEKVAILDAGAQYGKVSQLLLRTNLPTVLQTSFPGQVIDRNE